MVIEIFIELQAESGEQRTEDKNSLHLKGNNDLLPQKLSCDYYSIDTLNIVYKLITFCLKLLIAKVISIPTPSSDRR